MVVGDSIPDGFQSGSDLTRYPNFPRPDGWPSSPRATQPGGAERGHRRNRVLADYGRSTGGPALNRLEKDVLDQAGVNDVIVMEGTNDLGPPRSWPPWAPTS